jgi:hypothetical protein
VNGSTILLFVVGFVAQAIEGELNYSPSIFNTNNNSPGINTALYLKVIGWRVTWSDQL